MSVNQRSSLESTDARKSQWGSIDKLPVSKAYFYKLYPALNAAGVPTVILRAPGSKKGRRLVNLDAFDAFLVRLAEEQRQQEVAGK